MVLLAFYFYSISNITIRYFKVPSYNTGLLIRRLKIKTRTISTWSSSMFRLPPSPTSSRCRQCCFHACFAAMAYLSPGWINLTSPHALNGWTLKVHWCSSIAAAWIQVVELHHCTSCELHNTFITSALLARDWGSNACDWHCWATSITQAMCKKNIRHTYTLFMHNSASVPVYAIARRWSDLPRLRKLSVNWEYSTQGVWQRDGIVQDHPRHRNHYCQCILPIWKHEGMVVEL